MEPLVTPEQMTGVDGAPFSQAVLDAASASIRGEARWHIAPVITETVTLDSVGGRVLVLPTLRLVSVESVVDDEGVPIEGWKMSKAGMLSREAGWPCGFGAVVVTMTHGYEACPADLLPIIGDRTQRRVSQQSSGPFSVSYDKEGTSWMSGAFARFRLPGRA